MHQKFKDCSLFSRELSRFVLLQILQAHACIIVFTLFDSRDIYKYFLMYHKRSPSYIQLKYHLSRPQDCIAHIIHCHGKYSSFPDYTTIAQDLVDYIYTFIINTYMYRIHGESTNFILILLTKSIWRCFPCIWLVYFECNTILTMVQLPGIFYYWNRHDG